MSTPEPTEEELRAAMEEQLRDLRVEDVLLQTTVTLVNLAARRLGLAAGPEERDIEQARLAIEGARGLLPLMPTEQSDQIRDAMSQLQIAYAREAAAGGDPAAPGAGSPGAPPGAPPSQAAPPPGTPPSTGAPPPPGAPPRPPDAPPAPRESPEEARRRAEEEAERAVARSKIWTPRG